MFKNAIKKALSYRPLPETEAVRTAIEGARRDGLPYCPANEGDMIHAIIREGQFRNCLETGFHTGSTALYMASAVADRDGRVTSICVDPADAVEHGLSLLREQGHDTRHRLIQQNSNTALAELYLAGERFDFIFMDGWKTFDHLAYETYLFNQMLEINGVIAFDDSAMPSVRKVIDMLKRFYGYAEVDYGKYNQDLRSYLRGCLTTGSIHRPYRAIRKTTEVSDQPPFKDWHFHKNI